MHKGTVKWFNESQGYGFIKEEDGHNAVFVKHSEITLGLSRRFQLLKEGDRVLFDIEKDHTGVSAINVRLSQFP